jgi:hypothetical protein
MIAELQRAKRGQKIWFENITVRAPEGPRKVNSINLTIK